MDFLMWAGIIGGVLFLYFLPLIVASKRKHPNHTGIGLVNIFLGWTLIGWLIALVWAYSGQSEDDSGSTKCPYCAEIIRSEATVCRYCGKDVEEK